MLKKENVTVGEDGKIRVSGLGKYSLADTLECGQCFRHELVSRNGEVVEYIVPIGNSLLTVRQEREGELVFAGISTEEFYSAVIPYFTLDRDYAAINEEIKKRTDSEWLKRAADSAAGIAILKQDPWETLFSFIVSQNNNIPRIRKILRAICAEYGNNINLKKGDNTRCPLDRQKGRLSEEKCKECGVCYTFPTPTDIIRNPEGLLPSRPGFRYKYLLDAAKAVADGELNLDEIVEAKSYAYTVERLKTVKGVGDKVASCVALFGFSNLEAFPIDVWMRRAIDKYFSGSLDPISLGEYAGVAQQYIFHYIRNVEAERSN